MSAPPREFSPPQSSSCEWHGDSPEPELDDLACQHAPKPASRPEDFCNWKGDPAEPELDDLAYQHAPKPTESPSHMREPEPTPQALPNSPSEESSPPLPIVPTPEPVIVHVVESAEEPEDHHNKLPAPSPSPSPDPLPSHPASPLREVTPPPQLVVDSIPEKLSKAEREKNRREEKTRKHDEKRRARKEKERTKNELKKKEKAERKTKEREKREARDKEKREKKAKKENGHRDEPIQPPSPVTQLQEVEPEPIPFLPEERDVATGEAGTKSPNGWQVIPTLNTLADGIRKILPKPGSFSKSRKNSKIENELCPMHQLQDDIEHLNDHINQHLQEDKRHDRPGVPGYPIKQDKDTNYHKDTSTDLRNQAFDGTSDPRRTADCDQFASASSEKVITNDREAESSAQDRATQSTVLPAALDRTCDCGHSSNVRSSNDQQSGEAKISPQQAQPSRLKRASCLCGVMPPNSWEFAAYESPPFLTSRPDTPDQEDPYASKTYFAK